MLAEISFENVPEARARLAPMPREEVEARTAINANIDAPEGVSITAGS